jgi:hypothetical protein
MESSFHEEELNYSVSNDNFTVLRQGQQSERRSSSSNEAKSQKSYEAIGAKFVGTN